MGTLSDPGNLIDSARERRKFHRPEPPILWCDNHGYVLATERDTCRLCELGYEGFPHPDAPPDEEEDYERRDLGGS